MKKRMKKRMKRKFFGLIALLVVISVFAAGCSAGTGNKDTNKSNSADLLNAKWEKVLTMAHGQTVNMYMWGGSDTTNHYIDDWVAPRLKKEAGITLHRVPVNDTKDIINQLLSDKQAGKKNGSVDIMWINGENFLASKQNHLLFGPFVDKLPNYNHYVDTKSENITFDWGNPLMDWKHRGDQLSLSMYMIPIKCQTLRSLYKHWPSG